MKNKSKIFNVSLVVLMAIAVTLTTGIKLTRTTGGEVMLIVAAVGSLTGIMSTVLSANARIATFIFGLIDVTIYGVMCIISWKEGGSGLGNGLLHLLYFLPMQFLGFNKWRKLGAGEHKAVQARRLSGKQWRIYAGVFLGLIAICYLLLLRFDRSGAEGFYRSAVILDVIPLACNILGQFLMSSAYREQWIFWIGVNVFSVIMWISTYRSSGDSFALIYIIKYCFYLVNAVNGLRIWTHLSNLQKR